VIQPQKDFIDALRSITKAHNILLIVDEVMTGFRSQFGGAQKLLGIEADITCLGKVIGGGFPVGAYGARNEIMEMVAPLGGVYQAGTLSGNPIAMAAGLATLQELQKKKNYNKLHKVTKRIAQYLLDSAKEYMVDIQVNDFGSMVNPFFTNKKVTDFSSAQNSDTEKFKVFFWAMLENGVFIPPSQFESWFVSTAISKDDLNKIKEAINKAMLAVSKM